MIKRTFLYSTLVYLLSMIVTYLWNVGRNFSWANLVFMALFSLILAAIGLFIGVFLSAVFQRPAQEKWFYLIGQLLPVTTVAVLFFGAQRNDEKLKNSQENESYVFKLYGDFPQMGVAYDTLVKRFDDPNDFHIETTFSRDRYTHMRISRDSFWVIYFAYSLRNVELKERYAKLIVYNNVARMIGFNRSQADEEYSLLAQRIDSMKLLTDSLEKYLPPE